MSESESMTTAGAVLDRDIVLSMRDGQPIAVHANTLQLSSASPRCVLKLNMSAADLERVLRDGLLGFSTAASAGTLAQFDSQKPVHLELGLRTTIAAQLKSSSEADGGLLASVVRGLLEPGENRLREAESWRAVSVTQDVAWPDEASGDDGAQVTYARVGFQVPWAEDDLEDAGTTDAMAAVVQAVIEGGGWSYSRPDSDIFRLPMLSEEGGLAWTCLVRVGEKDAHDDTRRSALCIVYSVFREQVPEARRAEAALTLVQLNYDLPIGSFEMDLDDGEVRFRTGMSVGAEGLAPDAFERLIRGNIACFSAQLSILSELFEER